MRSRALAVIATILIPLGSAKAQTFQPRSGDRVRITAPTYTLTNQTADVVSVRSDSLFLQLAGDGMVAMVAVPITAVSRLDVSTGRRRHTLQGAGIGALVGAGSGMLIGFASGDDEPGFLAFTAGEKAALGGAVLGGAGLLLGAIVGTLNVTDRWASVPLGDGRAAPNFQMDRRGARIGVGLSF
jgi:hypothetical protein